MSRIKIEDYLDLDDVDDDNNTFAKRRRKEALNGADEVSYRSKRRTADGTESFKCGHCKAFIGPTVSGGRHRNHCPLCLYSRHVDDRQPGDRASTCRSLMMAIGTFNRPKGEQVILHRCLGCAVERYNRVAADDNLLACMHLPLVAPRSARSEAARLQGGEAERKAS